MNKLAFYQDRLATQTGKPDGQARRASQTGAYMLRMRHVLLILSAAVVPLFCAAAQPLPNVISLDPPLDAPAQPSADRLDQLAAPIALYPDTLVANMLAAATYPREVASASRWVTRPDIAALNGQHLADAAARQGWDTSVQALVRFPQLLARLGEHLLWTQHLGEAFLAEPAELTASIQRLRQRAQAARVLGSSPAAAVVNEGPDITIASPQGQQIYLPAYDPWCVFGPWPAPPEGPVYYAPWSDSCGGASAGIQYDSAIYLPYGFVFWGNVDWRHHHLRRGDDSLGDVWQYNPAHHRGVAYLNPALDEQFGAHPRAPARPAVRFSNADFRGHAAPAVAPQRRFAPARLAQVTHAFTIHR